MKYGRDFTITQFKMPIGINKKGREYKRRGRKKHVSVP